LNEDKKMSTSHASLAATPRRTAFTLIEVALAIAVVGIGVLAAFALLTTGLDSSARASEETQAAFFADSVMNTLRVYSTQEARTGNFKTFWDAFASGSRLVPVAFPRIWKAKPSPQSFQAGALQTITFKNGSLKDNVDTGIQNATARYRIDVTPASDGEQIPRSATMYVWPGKGNATTPKDADAFVFYSEFAYTGNL
jgi:prepilin-type N-terminal cleavage/methylation domain-containing protein